MLHLCKHIVKLQKENPKSVRIFLINILADLFFIMHNFSQRKTLKNSLKFVLLALITSDL
jgi:hypothetical protein